MVNSFHTYLDIPAAFTRATLIVKEFNPDFNPKLGEISPDFKYLYVEELCAGTTTGDESEDSDQEDDDREDDDSQGGRK
ncbi:hypothetical protein OROHE_005615 [Orobanche hederae]